jgi:hypothetical protein
VNPVVLLQLAFVLGLGALAAFLVDKWELLIGDKDTAFLIGFPLMLLYGLIYDLRQARRRRSSADRSTDVR